MTYRTTEVKVRGGALQVGVWEPDGPGRSAVVTPTVLAVHGITSSHLAWTLLAQKLTGTRRMRVLAPDLRGRGRSADLPGPWGFDQHADDLAAVLDQLGEADLTVGHSMGGFVTVVAAHRHAGRFGELVLVDGGVPLELPVDQPTEIVLERVLGPTAGRLRMRFPNREAHGAWWRDHPAFAGVWSVELAAYFDYDLVEAGAGSPAGGSCCWRSAARLDAVLADFGQQTQDGAVGQAWDAFGATGRIRDITFLRSPLGLAGEPPGLYPVGALEAFAAAHPGFRYEEVSDSNHYTVVLDHPGAEHLATVIGDRSFAGGLAAVARVKPDRNSAGGMFYR